MLTSDGVGWVCALESDPSVNPTNVNGVPRWDGNQLVDSALSIADNGDFEIKGTGTVTGALTVSGNMKTEGIGMYSFTVN